MSTPPPLPGHVFGREIPDGSNTYVNESTGEITTVPPSETRARRLAARQKRHEQAQAALRQQQRDAAVRGADAARRALPPRPAPAGLQRDAGPRLLDPATLDGAGR